MLLCRLKIGIKQYKLDEFHKSMHSLLPKIKSQEGCLYFSLYQDSERENMSIVVGEWKTRQAMEKHFKTHDFEVLIGAAKVLGETFEMKIAEVSQTGGFELVKELIASQRSKIAATN